MDRNVKGLLGEKLGMTQVWDESNRVVPVTVIKAGPNVVTTVRTPEEKAEAAEKKADVEETIAELDGPPVAPVAVPDKLPVTVPICELVPTEPVCAVPV